MSKSVVLCVFITLIGVSLAASRNYKTCKDHNDPSFSACLEEAANRYFADLDEDLNGVHHSLKPLETTINSGPLSVHLVYNITKYHNSTKSVKITLKYDASTKKLTGTIEAPQVGIEARCEVNGKFSQIILVGEGLANFKVWDMQASFETDLYIKPGSKTNFEMGKLKLKISSIRKAAIVISELNAKSKTLETALREVTKNFADEIYVLAKRQWDYSLQLHYEDLTREFLKEILDDGLVHND